MNPQTFPENIPNSEELYDRENFFGDPEDAHVFCDHRKNNPADSETWC